MVNNYNEEYPIAWYQTDDRDKLLEDQLGLFITAGGNGDWYVGVSPASNPNATINAVRLCTSGGASTLAPGLTWAIADAYHAIQAANEKKEYKRTSNHEDEQELNAWRRKFPHLKFDGRFDIFDSRDGAGSELEKVDKLHEMTLNHMSNQFEIHARTVGFKLTPPTLEEYIANQGVEDANVGAVGFLAKRSKEELTMSKNNEIAAHLEAAVREKAHQVIKDSNFAEAMKMANKDIGENLILRDENGTYWMFTEVKEISFAGEHNVSPELEIAFSATEQGDKIKEFAKRFYPDYSQPLPSEALEFDIPAIAEAKVLASLPKGISTIPGGFDPKNFTWLGGQKMSYTCNSNPDEWKLSGGDLVEFEVPDVEEGGNRGVKLMQAMMGRRIHPNDRLPLKTIDFSNSMDGWENLLGPTLEVNWPKSIHWPDRQPQWNPDEKTLSELFTQAVKINVGTAVQVHYLKSDPEVFQAVFDGRQTFEIRYDDRNYQVDDVLLLQETVFTGKEMAAGAELEYTGRHLLRRVTYKLSGYGLGHGWVILGTVKEENDED